MLTTAEKRNLYMKKYLDNKEIVDNRISNGIEKNRKGDCKIRITDENGHPIANSKVKITQKSHDFKYGANIFMLDEFDNEKDNIEYRRFFKEHFNLATVPFYWDTLEPNEGKPRYEKNSEKVYRRPAPDLCMEYCKENKITPKLHCLFYDKFTPSWLIGKSLEEEKELYEERFKQISERYSGKMFEFEVVNELLCYWDAKTPAFHYKDIVEWTFGLAKKYFPNETLVINETNPFQKIAKEKTRNPYYLMIENALLKGVSIDKIGLQNHMFTGVSAHTPEEYEESVKSDISMSDPIEYFEALDVMSDFGLPLEVTEVTVPTFGDTEEDELLQADILELWYSIWFSHKLVDTVVYWNTVEGYAYQGNPDWLENNCRGGLWHKDLTPKKSAERLYELFNKKWHTDLEIVTDENGYAEFRGFYGDYDVEADKNVFEIGIHKNERNVYELSK